MNKFFVAFLLLSSSILYAYGQNYPINYSELFFPIYCEEEDNDEENNNCLHFDEINEYNFCISHCYYFLRANKIKDIGIYNLSKIPHEGAPCSCCGTPSFYLGYVDPNFCKYTQNFEKQLIYTDSRRYSMSGWFYPLCQCYWPEICKEADEIRELAYILFDNLFKSSAFSQLENNQVEQKNFLQAKRKVLNHHEIVISLIVHQFQFSDYYQVCEDIEEYIKLKYAADELKKINLKIKKIIQALGKKFHSLYSECLRMHPCKTIQQEFDFLLKIQSEINQQ
jgi:hypothetical protein